MSLDDADDAGATVNLVREPPARPLGAVLRVVGASAQPGEKRLPGGSAVIGSAATCDVVISEPSVSRQHVELTLAPEGVIVRDLGSTNGTYYLGQRVEKMILSLGARIEVGSVTVVIDADGDLQGAVEHEGGEYFGVVGVSRAMRRVLGALVRLSGSLVPVLLEGESGVGKAHIARALHEASAIAYGPLVNVSCGSTPREVMVGELLAASGGTLFLDDVGDLPLDAQALVLRALEAGELRVAGEEPRPIKVRVVAATDRDLAAEARAGRFREDLFYRLAVVRLAIPPLRERVEDVEPLARRFAEAAGVTLPPHVIEAMKSRSWPGNAREVEGAVQAYAVLGVLPESGRSKEAVLDLALSEMIEVRRPYGDQKEDLSERFTRLYLRALMTHTRGNQSAAARIAGLDRTYLGRLLVKHGIAKG